MTITRKFISHCELEFDDDDRQLYCVFEIWEGVYVDDKLTEVYKYAPKMSSSPPVFFRFPKEINDFSICLRYAHPSRTFENLDEAVEFGINRWRVDVTAEIERLQQELEIQTRKALEIL